MEHIEYEERVMIKESDYKKVIDDLMSKGYEIKPFTIENIYLDNDEKIMQKGGMMLRIRNVLDKQELTLKIRNKDNSNVEINETVENHPIIDEALNHKFKEFKEVVRLVTQRIELKIDDYLLVIDKNMYHNIVDYDVEIETDSQAKAKKIILEYCEKYNWKYKSDYKVKSARAFAALKKDGII